MNSLSLSLALCSNLSWVELLISEQEQAQTNKLNRSSNIHNDDEIYDDQDDNLDKISSLSLSLLFKSRSSDASFTETYKTLI